MITTKSTNIFRKTARIANILSQKLYAVPDLQVAMQPASKDFATIPTIEGFNWNKIGAAIWRNESKESRKKEKYLVVFRSTRKVDADIPLLVTLEEQAYEDAKKTGALIAYMAGPITNDRKNVSFCIWKSSEKAYIASHRNPHSKATEIVGKAYERYDLERYLLTTKWTIRGLKTILSPIESNPAAAHMHI
jgi:hypothetical protein